MGIVRFQGDAKFEAKVKKAVKNNKFWSPNDGFFWEIEDLKSISDIKFFDVVVGSRVIDVLTGSGVLIDQKYTLELDRTDPNNPVIKPGMWGQIQAMQNAVGSKVEGITVIDWEYHPKEAIAPDVRAFLISIGIDMRHFKR